MTEPDPQVSPPSPRSAREVRLNTSLRQARTCYDHLAGVAGVTLLEAMLQLEWLAETGVVKERIRYKLTAEGGKALLRRDVDLFPAKGSKRMYAYGCADWTERHLHLGGTLGAALLKALIGDGFIAREKGSRNVELLRPIEQWVDGSSI